MLWMTLTRWTAAISLSVECFQLLMFFLRSWECLTLMATVSSASLRWRGESASVLFFLIFCFVPVYIQKLLFNLADVTESFLSFYRRLLPVHENFLLKFEVRFEFDWFSRTNLNCSLVTVAYTQNSIVQHYWIISKWTVVPTLCICLGSVHQDLNDHACCCWIKSIW